MADFGIAHPERESRVTTNGVIIHYGNQTVKDYLTASLAAENAKAVPNATYVTLLTVLINAYVV